MIQLAILSVARVVFAEKYCSARQFFYFARLMGKYKVFLPESPGLQLTVIAVLISP